MISDKKERVDTGTGKDQNIHVGEYQNREVGRGRWGHLGRENGMEDVWEGREPEKRKRNVNRQYNQKSLHESGFSKTICQSKLSLL